MNDIVDKLITNFIKIFRFLTIFLHTESKTKNASKVFTFSYFFISSLLVVINSN